MEILLPTARTSIRPGKILCIGRNYAKHAAEMQSAVPDQPMVFLKPSTALVASGEPLRIPPPTNDVHHEIELVVVIGRGGAHIREEEALDHVDGYAVGLDMTARDLQAQAKKKGHPWSVAKGFDTFAPVGEFIPALSVPDPQDLELTLEINGTVRQHGFTRDMIFPVARLIAFCSTIFTLEPGDLLFTGTPEGVGPVREGEVLEARIAGLPILRTPVVQATA